VKKNVVYISSRESFELDPMISKQATRIENKKGSKSIADIQTLNLSVPKPLQH